MRMCVCVVKKELRMCLCVCCMARRRSYTYKRACVCGYVCASVCGCAYLQGGCVCVVMCVVMCVLMCVVMCVVMYTYKEVVELDVAVDNARGVTVLEAGYYLRQQPARLMLRQPVTLAGPHALV